MDLPETLPIFPLSGVILLPQGLLPLNVFEPRYLAMTDYALGQKGRLVGMIQPLEGQEGLYQVGCAGRIINFAETEDGRYLINLQGVARFRVLGELPKRDGFRMVQSDFTEFADDLGADVPLRLERDRLCDLLKAYFSVQDLSCDWKKLGDADAVDVLNVLCMTCPFTSSEKQMLLEAVDLHARRDLLFSLLQMGAHDFTPDGLPH